MSFIHVKNAKNKKILILVVIVVCVAGVGAIKLWKRSSAEMKSLRQLESSLKLPAAKGREEVDKGAYTDEKGTKRTDRYIVRYYMDIRTVEDMVKSIASQGWNPVNQTTDKSKITYRFVKDKQACLSVSTDSASTDRLPHSVFLRAPSDDGCKDYMSDAWRSIPKPS